ncbi:MAG: ribonuclease PH [Planctomycetota bacterium]
MNRTRPVRLRPGFTAHAAGSVLAAMGRTQVLCTAMVQSGVPPFLKGKGQGWLTCEYDMLPSATPDRHARAARKGGGVPGRTSEIQRLIGRSLREAVDLAALGERTIHIDCDVLQADGSTRTTAINGGCVALALACRKLVRDGVLTADPFRGWVGAVSVGLVDGRLAVDLDYAADSAAGVDMNVVMNAQGRFIEIQGTAERRPFDRRDLDRMLAAAARAIRSIIRLQRKAAGRA